MPRRMSSKYVVYIGSSLGFETQPISEWRGGKAEWNSGSGILQLDYPLFEGEIA